MPTKPDKALFTVSIPSPSCSIPALAHALSASSKAHAAAAASLSSVGILLNIPAPIFLSPSKMPPKSKLSISENKATISSLMSPKVLGISFSNVPSLSSIDANDLLNFSISDLPKS